MGGIEFGNKQKESGELDFSIAFGNALGLSESCKLHTDASAKQVRVDKAINLLNVAWEKYLAE